MKRILLASVLVLSCWTVAASDAHAQVFIRAPFVRVQVGPGVAVRAPFVRLWVPPAPVFVYPPGTVIGEPPPMVPPPPTVEVAPKPGPVNDTPIPLQPAKAPTLEQFAKTFQARPGSYEVDVINPVTNQPTRVRFTLPDGTPKSVNVRPNEIVFRYGPLRFVRIEFDKDGAQVVSR
jgi:hypothetical protein